MTGAESEPRGNAILFHGAFNPQILQPAWLAARDLIREAESETAEIEVVHPDIVVFALDWAALEVERERLTISSTPKTETFEQVRDLALGIIQTLSHTPIHSVGLQFYGDYSMKDQETRDQLGWALAPPEPFQGLLERPGMGLLRMEGFRPGEQDDEKGALRVRIEPSRRLTPHGVHISVLDHYIFGDPTDIEGADSAIACIEENWAESIERAAAIPEQIISFV